MKKLPLLLIAILVVAIGWFVVTRDQSATITTSDTKPPGFNKQQFSLDNPNSLWVVANKQRPLQPTSYQPTDLVAPNVALRLNADTQEMQMRKSTATAIEQLFAAAKQDGYDLLVSSAFRSREYQEGLYNTYVRQQGRAVADTQSARPGHSEHQTGLAVDIGAASRECEIEECFGDMPEGKWVAANAYKFGFIVRYQKDKQSITGYIYEPWHLRFVGKELAAELHKQGTPTLEEFFGLPAAPDYN